MAESAALLADEVLPEQPMRQWVLSFPFPLRLLFASRPTVMGQVRTSPSAPAPGFGNFLTLNGRIRVKLRASRLIPYKHRRAQAGDDPFLPSSQRAWTATES